MTLFSDSYYHFRCLWPGMPKLPKITSLLFLYNMLRKKWVMQLIFYVKISMKVDIKIFWWVWSSIPKVLKIASLQFLHNISKKKVEMKLTFWRQKNIKQSFLQVDFVILGIKVLGIIMKTWRAWWWAWSSILKLLKVTSLQCLYNIYKKKLWLQFIMMFIKTKTSTSWIIDFWLKQTCPKYPKKEVCFCNILIKSIVTIFVFYFYAKHSDTLEAPSMFVITCFCKHPNCLDFARSVLVCGMLSQCSGLNQFVLAFIFLTKKKFIFA